MSLEENKAVVRRLLEAANIQDLSSLNDLVAPDYVNHTRQMKGREGYIQYVTTHFKTFPDFHVTIEDVIAEGEKVCVRIKVTGTHRGEFHALPPTGKKIEVRGVQIYRIVDGRIVEGWTDYNFHQDQTDSLKQLGVIEYTERGRRLFPEDAT